jgi:hypothetical protein
MENKPDPELVDDENPELTEEWFRKAIPFAKLPESLKAKLLGKTTAGTEKNQPD